MKAAMLALRVLGGAENRREVVSYGKAVAAYAAADPSVRPELPAFLSAFTFTFAMRDHVNATGSTRDYRGPVGVPMLNWDIDRHDLDEAIRDTARLAHFVADRYSLDATDLVVSFSGRKGFHVQVPTARMVEPSPIAHRVARTLATELADAARVVIDCGVYDAVRLWRAPNSRHPSTGLYKVAVDLDDLPHLTGEAVRRRAVEPIPFDLPAPALPPARLAADWSDAARRVAQQTGERRERHTERTGRLNLTTRTLLSDPTTIGMGDRHRTVFSAAADLAAFDTVDDLITALLTEPAGDTGLPPREVERQIRTGIEHARRGRAEGGAP